MAGTLVIGDTGSLTASGPMSVDVGVPSLTALSLSGSGQISAIAISTPQLTVTISGKAAKDGTNMDGGASSGAIRRGDRQPITATAERRSHQPSLLTAVSRTPSS